MAGERVIWLVWNPDRPGVACWYPTRKNAEVMLASLPNNSSWRCSQITVKETDGE